MDHFHRDDLYELQEELDVQKRARDEGRRDKPARTDETPDEPQRAIMGAINERLNSARSEGEERLKAIEVELGAIDLSATANALRNLRVDTEMEIERTKGDFRDKLTELRLRERGMRRELNHFQLDNDLNREAHYPDSEILHWAIIAALVVTESLANSYFFARGSDLGLLGGALQALLISTVNIGAALLAGVYILRNLHHASRTLAMVSGGGLALYLCFLIFFNLSTAHYRAQLGIDPLAALVNAISSLVRNPLGINDFDATVLLFIGIIFSIAALTKAYFADDRYPGFGKIDRRYHESNDDYQEGKQELRSALNKVIDRAREVLNQYLVNARDASREYASLVAESESVANDFERHAQELRENCHRLLNLYRTVNKNARTSKPPDYFADYPPTEVKDVLQQGDGARMKKRFSEIEKHLSQIEDQTSGVMQELKDLNELALKDVEKFFDEIDQEAEKRIESDAAMAPDRDDRSP